MYFMSLQPLDFITNTGTQSALVFNAQTIVRRNRASVYFNSTSFIITCVCVTERVRERETASGRLRAAVFRLPSAPSLLASRLPAKSVRGFLTRRVFTRLFYKRVL